MFPGRIHRKKRKVLLSPLHPAPKTRRVMSWSRPIHDAPAIERNWWESTARSHACCCGCGNFVNHINVLANRYGFTGSAHTPGGPRPRPPTVSSGPSTSYRHPETGFTMAWGYWWRRRFCDRGDAGRRWRRRRDYNPEDLDALFDALDEE
uniref:ORF2 protein n=1 Tax=Torque teno virus TaxID=68887 RepID=Q9IWX0_9VIRU|nr:ORF2 protein [Torque teno virus]